MHERLNKILRELYWDGYGSGVSAEKGEDNDDPRDIEKAVQAVIDYFLSLLPKERDMSGDFMMCRCDSAVGGTFCKCDFSENDGYNQAINDMAKIIKWEERCKKQ